MRRRKFWWVVGGLLVVLCLQFSIFDEASVPLERDAAGLHGRNPRHRPRGLGGMGERALSRPEPSPSPPDVPVVSTHNTPQLATAAPNAAPPTNEVPSTGSTSTHLRTAEPTAPTAPPTAAPTVRLSTAPRSCALSQPDALSAVSRAHTDACRTKIRSTACSDEQRTLYPELRPNPLPSCRGTLPRDTKAMVARGLPKGADRSAAPLRIAYLIACHGRSFRQVKRLIRLIYDPRHFIMIHVDSRSAYMHRRLTALVSELGPNVWLTSWRMATIWGGLNLYQMYLRAIRELLVYPWDYFINLSGADLPIAPLGKLAAFLKEYRPFGANFLTSHSNERSFVQKQGLNKTWVLCDNHMWRTGPRAFPPQGVRVEGGSDWYIMHRTFCEFVTSDTDQFVQNLTKWYDQSLLGAESFFHTALINGPMCNTLVGMNHRLANWNRARGCKCQYKAIVDWCGCSPNVILMSDKNKLLQNVASGMFFARKFDGKISNSVIDFVEATLVNGTSTAVHGFYWESAFDIEDETPPPVGVATYFSSFARLGVANISSVCGARSPLDTHSTQLMEVHLVMKDDKFLGYAVKVAVGTGSQRTVFETLMTTDDEFRFSQKPRAGQAKTTIGPIGVGVDYDGKERVFNRRGGMVSSVDPPVIAGLWPIVQQFSLSVDFRGPTSHVKSSHTHGTGRERLLFTYQHIKTLEPGAWLVSLTPDRRPGYEKLSTSPLEMRFPVAAAHPHVVPAHLENDALIASFWKLDDLCSVARGDCSSTLPIPLCKNTAWSSMRDRADITVTDILSAKH